MAEFIVVCSSTRDKQHAQGQQSKPQMQLQGVVRCKLQAILKQPSCKEPIKQPAAACAGMAWVQRVQSSCEFAKVPQTLHAGMDQLLACINSHPRWGPWGAAADTCPRRGCRHAVVNTKLQQQLVVDGKLLVLQQLMVEDGGAHKGPATVCHSALIRLRLAAAVQMVQRAWQMCRCSGG